MIFFKGNLAKDTMSEILESGGLLVEQLVVYETKDSSELETDLASIQLPDWVVLFSPSGARAALPLLDSLPKERSFKFVAIGEVVGFGHNPISPQGQQQETRFCVWASTLQELLQNLPLMVCCPYSEAGYQTEDIFKLRLVIKTNLAKGCFISAIINKMCYISDLAFFHNEESKGKGGSRSEFIARVWLRMQALQVLL